MTSVLGRRFLSLEEIAQMLRVHRRTVGNWVRKGKFPAPVRIGRTFQFEIEKVEIYLQAAQQPVTAETH